MKKEDRLGRVLDYLKRKGEANTFRIARELKIDRYKLQRNLKELVEKKVVELRLGTVKLLKFPEKYRQGQAEEELPKPKRKRIKKKKRRAKKRKA